MTLTKKEIQSIAKDPSIFYLYKEKATAPDIVKIINQTLPLHEAYWLLPVIKIAAEKSLITDEVKIAMLTQAKEESSQIQYIADMFQMYKIDVSDEFINTHITHIAHRFWKIGAILSCFQPHLNKNTIERILDVISHNAGIGKTLNYIIKQLNDAKDYKFITQNNILFTHLKQDNRALATQIVEALIDAHEFEHITNIENKEASSWAKYMLFSDALIEKMINACLAAHQSKFIITNQTIWNYLSTNYAGEYEKTEKLKQYKKQAIHQLFDSGQHFTFLTENQNALSYIINQEPELLKGIPQAFYFNAIETVKHDDNALKLMNLLPLPNETLEHLYIKNNRDATTQFPPYEKLSSETQNYISIIKDLDKLNPVFHDVRFTNLTPRKTSALINLYFNDKGDWYKLMECLLANRPNLDKKYIKQMLDRDPKIEPIIKKRWNGSLRQMRAQDFIETRKKQIRAALGKKEKSNTK